VTDDPPVSEGIRVFETAQWRGRLGVLAARRPAEIWSLALLYGVSSAGCMFAAAFPMSDQAPLMLLWVVAAVSAVVGAALWLFGGAVPRPVVHLGVAASTVIKSLLIAFAATPQGELVTAFGYLWVAVYAAHFFGRREAWRHAMLITVGFGVALWMNDTPSAPGAYVIVVATIWVAVTVLSNLTTRLREHAATDQLTGLLNRSGFRSAAEREHALSLRTSAPVSLVVIDLDGFKAVNDWRGHAAGDQLLVDLAEMWRLRLRRCDVIGRYGGDEFVLLLPATDGDQATVAVSRLKDGSPIAWSAGVAEWGTGESFETCLSRADSKLYLAKPDRGVPRQRGARPGVRAG
jgi:diguanylate cyclase (GGDEF)-like protein